jgi:peptide/nickel transport system permease protein
VGGSLVLKLIAQRVALGVLLLFAVSVLIFAGTQILPGDVAATILGQSATPQALANLRAELGLNDPAVVRYFRWLGGILTGDLGTKVGQGLRRRPLAE